MALRNDAHRKPLSAIPLVNLLVFNGSLLHECKDIEVDMADGAFSGQIACDQLCRFVGLHDAQSVSSSDVQTQPSVEMQSVA